MRIKSWLLGGVLCACAGMAGAVTLYRWVDAEGVVHYSDQPHAGATRIEVQGAQTYHASHGTIEGATASIAERPIAPIAGYQQCVIAQPAAEETLVSPSAVHIAVHLDPALQSGDSVAVALDGTPLPGARGTLDFTVNEIDRGEHTVSAVVRDGAGRVACTAPSVQFYVQRPSLLLPDHAKH